MLFEKLILAHFRLGVILWIAVIIALAALFAGSVSQVVFTQASNSATLAGGVLTIVWRGTVCVVVLFLVSWEFGFFFEPLYDINLSSGGRLMEISGPAIAGRVAEWIRQNAFRRALTSVADIESIPEEVHSIHVPIPQRLWDEINETLTGYWLSRIVIWMVTVCVAIVIAISFSLLGDFRWPVGSVGLLFFGSLLSVPSRRRFRRMLISSEISHVIADHYANGSFDIRRLEAFFSR